MSLMPISFCFAVSRREKMKAGCSIVDKPEGGGGKEVERLSCSAVTNSFPRIKELRRD